MRMPSQEKTLQRLQNPAETLCERPRAGTARRRLRHSQARRAKRKSIPADGCMLCNGVNSDGVTAVNAGSPSPSAAQTLPAAGVRSRDRAGSALVHRRA